MTDRLDDLLRQAGRSFAGSPPAAGPDADDVARRGRARARHQRLGVAALAAVLLAGILLLRPGGGSQEVQYGGSSPGPGPAGFDVRGATAPAAPAPTPAPTPAAPPGVAPGATLPEAPTTLPPAPGPPGPPPARTRPPRPTVRDVDFQHLTYPADSCAAPAAGPVTVWDGTGEPTNRATVQVSYGDLTGDGVDEALVVLECQGGAPAPLYAWVWLNSRAGPERGPAVVPDPATLRLLERTHGIRHTGLRGASLVRGSVASNWNGLRDTDANCCPGFSFDLRQRLTDTVLATTLGEVRPTPP